MNSLEDRIADLENRARAALEMRRDDLALQAAAAIAELEAERDATGHAGLRMEEEISALRGEFEQAQRRLADLDRGRKLSRAQASLLGLRQDFLKQGLLRSNFNEAEDTLQKLRDEQAVARDAEAAWVEIDAQTRPSQVIDRQVIERLAAHGCGPRLRPSAQDVLLRLKAPVTE